MFASVHRTIARAWPYAVPDRFVRSDHNRTYLVDPASIKQLFRRLSHASASMIIHTGETANSSLIQLVRITGVESNLRWIPAVTRKLIHVIKL